MKKEVKKQKIKENKSNDSWNHFAIAGFIFAFLSWFSILGIALSIIGIIETKRKQQKGRSLAITGLIIGILVLIAKSYNFYIF